MEREGLWRQNERKRETVRKRASETETERHGEMDGVEALTVCMEDFSLQISLNPLSSRWPGDCKSPVHSGR